MPANRQRILYLLITLAFGVILLWPGWDSVSVIAQGDHGRDLYAAEQTLHGARPYRDYWWVYGPIMPAYYALWFEALGVKIASVLIGRLFLNLLSGVFIYMAISLAAPPCMALVAAVWFWLYQPEFFYTFNHAGGLTCATAALWALVSYVMHRRPRSLVAGLVAIFLLAMVKLNFGLAALMPFVGAVAWLDFRDRGHAPFRRAWFYELALLALPLAILGVIGFLVRGLPVYSIRECFPYFGNDYPYHVSIWSSLLEWLRSTWTNINTDWRSRFMAVLVVFSLAQFAAQWVRRRLDRRAAGIALIIAAFYVVFLHEFVMSGVTYTTFWATPFSIVLIFLLVSQAIRPLHGTVRCLLIATILITELSAFHEQLQLNAGARDLGRRFAHERAHVYVGNGAGWVRTVEQATEFLSQNVGPGEMFFALPYDPLYYYLAGRTSPTRQLIFFEHIRIPDVQEREVIADLEAKRVNWVLLSNRTKGAAWEKGVFGETYGRVLQPYLAEHFEEVAAFGGTEEHAVRILRRRSTP